MFVRAVRSFKKAEEIRIAYQDGVLAPASLREHQQIVAGMLGSECKCLRCNTEMRLGYGRVWETASRRK
jgi:hypothetical protein